MPYVVGSETATAAIPIEYNPDESYWHDETLFATGIRKLNQLNLIEENSSRYSDNSYILASSLRIYGMPHDFYQIYNPFILVQFNPSEDWIISSWESTYHLFSKSINFADTIRKISELANLPDNWDSYGALKIEKDTITRAIDFILDLMNMSEKFVSLSRPNVVPCPDGSIQFEWYYEDKELEIELPYSSEELVVYLRKYGNIFEEGSCDYKEVIEQLHWLLQDKS